MNIIPEWLNYLLMIPFLLLAAWFLTVGSCILVWVIRFLASCLAKERFRPAVGDDPKSEPVAVLNERAYLAQSYLASLVLLTSFLIYLAWLFMSNQLDVSDIYKYVLARIIIPFTIIYCSYMLIDLLCSKQIALYSDKVVKEWYFFGKCTVFLNEARLVRQPLMSGNKCIVAIYANNFFKAHKFMHIRYVESSVDVKSLKLFEIALAGLTGRSHVEITKCGKIKPLIKEPPYETILV